MAHPIPRFLRSLVVLAAVSLPPLTARGNAAASFDGAAQARSALGPLLERAREKAPEVESAKVSLEASRTVLATANRLPFGSPRLEVTADRVAKKVIKDAVLTSSLWIPVEVSGQGSSRVREARELVALQTARLEQARAQAAARLVRAYGAVVVSSERREILSGLLSDARAEAQVLDARSSAGDAVLKQATLSSGEATKYQVMLSEADAALTRAQRELSELLDRAEGELVAVAPPVVTRAGLASLVVESLPGPQVLRAEARFHFASSERLRSEGQPPINVGLVTGQGDLGEPRVGAGLAFAPAVLGASRPQRTRVSAEGERALARMKSNETMIGKRLQQLQREQEQLTRALAVVSSSVSSAASAAVRAARDPQIAVKAEPATSRLTRRELSMQALRRLELVERSWQIASEYVALTGNLP